MDNHTKISGIALRKEQTDAARKLVEQASHKRAEAEQALTALRGYLMGLALEHGQMEGSWDFSPDLLSIRRTDEK